MTLIAELALGKGVDVLSSVLLGSAKRMWEKGPVGRVLVLLRVDFEEKSGLGRDDFFAWEQDDVIATALDDLTSGRDLPGPNTEGRLAAAFEPKLYRIAADDRPALAMAMARAAQQAAPLVAEGGPATALLANRMDQYMGTMSGQLAGMQKQLDLLTADRDDPEDRVDPTPAAPGVPVPPQAGKELAEIAEALLRAPLERAGRLEAARRANDLLEAGDVDGAAKAMREVAEGLWDAGSLTLAERYREWAASSLIDAGATEQAADLLIEVAIAQAQRGSELVQYSAGRLRDVLPEERQWLPDAIEAMSSWPEQPAEAIELLRTAVAESDPDLRLQWVAALVEVLLVVGEHQQALDASSEIVETDLERGHRVAVELDYLEAEEQLGNREQTEARWQRLLAFAEERDDLGEQRGVVWQRYMRTLLHRGDLPGATEAAGKAVEAWSHVRGADQQAAEPLLDLHTGALLLAQQPPGWDLRSLATGARGTAETPGSIAERLETRAVAARIQGKLPEALRSWSLALLTHRRAGNFHGEQEVSESLGELYAHAQLPIKALSFFLFSGRAKEAVEAAASISGEAIAQVIELDSPRWQLAAVYEVLAEHGRRLPEEAAAEVAERMLADAAQAPDGFIAPQPAASARRALARTLLALPEDWRNMGAEQLRRDLGDPAEIAGLQAACEALILATNAGLLDESELLIKGFLQDASLRNISTLWVAERLEARDDLREPVRTAAIAGSHSALEALAAADLVDGDTELEAFCDTATSSAAERETVTTQHTPDGRVETSIGIGVHFEGVAIIARGAGEEARSNLLRRLMVTLTDDREPEINRASAANAVFNLAASVPVELLDELVKVLKGLAQGAYESSEIDRQAAASQHPMSRFRIGLDAPQELRSSALQAWAHLAAKHPQLKSDDLKHEVEVAFRTTDARVLRGALKSLAELDEISPPVPLERFLLEPDPHLKLAALDAMAARGESPIDLDALPLLLKDPEVAVRLSLLVHASIDGPVSSEPLLHLLAVDEDAYVRAMAATALRDFR